MVQEVVQLPVRRYKRTPIWQRFLSLLGLGAMGGFLGVALSIAVGLSIIGVFWLLSGITK
jgi:hypothetical protein